MPIRTWGADIKTRGRLSKRTFLEQLCLNRLRQKCLNQKNSQPLGPIPLVVGPTCCPCAPEKKGIVNKTKQKEGCDGIRTRNLLIRSQARYHFATRPG